MESEDFLSESNGIGESGHRNGMHSSRILQALVPDVVDLVEHLRGIPLCAFSDLCLCFLTYCFC